MILIYSIIIFVLTLFVVSSCLLIVQNFIQLSDVWIDFLGTTISGSLTMAGVIMTLSHYNKKSKEEFSMRIMPFIRASVNSNFNYMNSEFPIVIENVSKYPIRDLVIDGYCCNLNNAEIDIEIELNHPINFLPKGEKCLIKIVNIDTELSNLDKSDELEISISCRYYDSIGNIEYNHDFDFCIENSPIDYIDGNPNVLRIENVHNIYNGEAKEYQNELVRKLKKAFK